MFTNPMQQTVLYEDLLREIKCKNKQIRFLEDKIILIQNQRQAKIKQIEARYTYQISKYKQAETILQEQNLLLRKRHQQRQLAHTSLQQSYKQLSTQVKVLAQANTSANKHTKSMKRKYVEQGREINKIQQQNNRLRSLISVLQKQLKEITSNNMKLIQEKNYLLKTYQDYDRVKYQLQQIKNINEEQYRREVEIVKSKLRQEMDHNTKIIVDNQLMSNNRGEQLRIGENMQTTVPKVANNHLLDSEDDDNQIEQQYKNEEIVDSDHIPSRYQQQNGNNTVNTPTHQLLIGSEAINPIIKSSIPCQQCIFERAWSQDVIRLRHLVSYGQEYLRAMLNNKKRSNNNQQNHDKEQSYVNEPQQPSNNSLNLSSFNHQQSASILSFILDLIQSKFLLQQELLTQSTMINELKTQLTQQTESLLQRINGLTEQYEQKDRLLQTIQQKHETQIHAIQQQRMGQLQHYNMIKSKLNSTQQHQHHFQIMLQAVTKLFATILNKYLLQSSKLTFYYKLAKQQFNYNYIVGNDKYNSGGNYQLNQKISHPDKNTMMITNQRYKRGLKTKLNKAIITVLFIVTLKRKASKLRRRTMLTLGIKSKSKHSLPLISSQNDQDKSIIIKNTTTDQFYTTSTYDLISQHYSIPKQLKIQYQWTPNHLAQISSTQKTHQILQRCIYENVRDQILTSKLRKSKNLEIQKYFNNLENSENMNEKISIHQQIMKIICQEMFLQKSL